MQKLLIEYLTDEKLYLKSVNYRAFKSQWESFVNKNYNGSELHTILSAVNWIEWVENPGLAPV